MEEIKLIKCECVLCDGILKNPEYEITINGKEATIKGYLCRECFLKMISGTAPHKIKASLRVSGGSLIFTFPKSLVEHYNIHKGDEIIIRDFGIKIIRKTAEAVEK